MFSCFMGDYLTCEATWGELKPTSTLTPAPFSHLDLLVSKTLTELPIVAFTENLHKISAVKVQQLLKMRIQYQ